MVGVEQKLPQVFNIMILHSQNLEKKLINPSSK